MSCLGGTILAETKQFQIIYYTELAVSQYPIYCSCTLPLTMIYISAKGANTYQNLFQWELKFDQYYEELQIVGRCNSVEDNVFRKLTFNTKFQHGLFGDFCYEVFRCYGRNTVGVFCKNSWDKFQHGLFGDFCFEPSFSMLWMRHGWCFLSKYLKCRERFGLLFSL